MTATSPAASAPPDVDVCLIVEGAYPYVVGGVSAWVQDLIRNLPDIRFAIVAIKPSAAPVATWVTTETSSPPSSTGTSAWAIAGATVSARPRLSTTLAIVGTARVENGGTTSSQATMRTEASR